jgi:hypothetical protein
MPVTTGPRVYRPPGWQGPAQVERDASGNPIPKKGGKRTRKNRKTRKAHKRRRYSRRH